MKKTLSALSLAAISLTGCDKPAPPRSRVTIEITCAPGKKAVAEEVYWLSHQPRFAKDISCMTVDSAKLVTDPAAAVKKTDKRRFNYTVTDKIVISNVPDQPNVIRMTITPDGSKTP